MSEIFISYARPNEPEAIMVDAALRALGYQVWRDEDLPAHRPYAEVIQERLASAGAVIVLWSEEAGKSQWVRAEADAARNAGTLVQVSLDGSMPPLPFNQIQCAELSSWDGNVEAPGWRKLSASLSALVGAGHRAAAEGAPPMQSARSICVLPFSNMSGDAEQEYFSDGISEDITTDLSKVSALAVTARNTAFTFKGQAVDVCEVARKLGVSHVVEGSVRKAGGRVRITAQLIDGATGDHLWAERYDRELNDIFAIQDEISKAIVDALKVKLLPEEKKAIANRGTDSVDAYNLYLMARQYWIAGNWGDIRQLELVSRICQRAVEIDPAYARAWGLLAIAQCLSHFAFNTGDDDGTAAADRALAIDPNIAEAYVVRARQRYEQGQLTDVDKLLARALELEPHSWEVNREAARIFFFLRRFREAVEHYERAGAAVETDYHSWGMLCSAYESLGDKAGARRAGQMAIVQSERVLAHDPTNGNALGMAGYGLAVIGEHGRFREWVERALLINPDNTFMRYNFACTMAVQLNDPDAAMDLLEPIVPQFSASVYNATLTDPDLDSLHEHPRFKRMMEQAGKALGFVEPNPVASSEPPRS
jgi:adenylate cyclase